LQVGEETTEILKTRFATTFLPEEIEKKIMVRGRDVQTGSPAAVEVTVGEIYPVVESIVRRTVQIVSDTLTELRPEVAADIYDRGIILTAVARFLTALNNTAETM
jgi:rod shape-determining protein MreB